MRLFEVFRVRFRDYEWFRDRDPEIAHLILDRAKNKPERDIRLDWLSQGMLKNHIDPTDGVSYPDPQEVKLYREFMDYLSRR